MQSASSAGALRMNQSASYWQWEAMAVTMPKAISPTRGTNLLYGLDEALNLLLAEGLDRVFARHSRLAAATREAVNAWGLENVCMNSEEYCNSTTAVFVPEGFDADDLRMIIRERFNMSLGTGLGKLKNRIFRISHIGDFNDLMLMGTLSGVEMGLKIAISPINREALKAQWMRSVTARYLLITPMKITGDAHGFAPRSIPALPYH